MSRRAPRSRRRGVRSIARAAIRAGTAIRASVAVASPVRAARAAVARAPFAVLSRRATDADSIGRRRADLGDGTSVAADRGRGAAAPWHTTRDRRVAAPARCYPATVRVLHAAALAARKTAPRPRGRRCKRRSAPACIPGRCGFRRRTRARPNSLRSSDTGRTVRPPRDRTAARVGYNRRRSCSRCSPCTCRFRRPGRRRSRRWDIRSGAPPRSRAGRSRSRPNTRGPSSCCRMCAVGGASAKARVRQALRFGAGAQGGVRRRAHRRNVPNLWPHHFATRHVRDGWSHDPRARGSRTGLGACRGKAPGPGAGEDRQRTTAVIFFDGEQDVPAVRAWSSLSAATVTTGLGA
jgi:hypothetical protein